MLQNYLKAAFRNVIKQRFFTILNVLGLATGIAAFMLIMLYVNTEQSYEKFLDNSKSIYRVTLAQYINNELSIESAENYPGVGPALLSEIPETVSFARLYNMGYKNNLIITYDNPSGGDPIKFKHRKFLYADSAFLPMMGYPMMKGDAATALAEPLTAVISETYAKKYFGDEEPIGKVLHLQDDDFNDELATVTGVFKDLPATTHLKFDVLFSYKTLYSRGEWAPARYNESWRRKDMYTYIQLIDGSDIEAIEDKLPAIIDKYSPDLADQNRKDILALQPLRDIHLTSNLAEEPEVNGNRQAVDFMAIIALFIIVIAWVNYINLSTAKAMERANEVGVRKVMGAGRHQLVIQYLMEAGMINLMAILIASLIMIFSLPTFNTLSGLNFDFSDLLTGSFGLALLVVWFLGSISSGIYPAVVMSGFIPVTVLKGKGASKYRSGWLRRALVVFQFATSIALITGTFIVYNQLKFMKNQDIGMNIDQMLVVERPGITSQDREARIASIEFFKNQVKEGPNIQSVTGSITVPGKKREYKVPVKPYGAGDDKLVTLRFNSMDYEFIDAFEMELISGRAFSEDFVNDPDTSVILSESAVKLLGFNPENIIGQTIAIPNFRWNPIVAGVVNDYNQESLQKSVDPTIFNCSPTNAEFFSIKVSTEDLANTITHVENAWNEAFPGNPFQYFFLDDYFNQQYENEQKFGDLFMVFASLAVIIGCLGLFGLSAFTTQQRTKEVGIRKVLGSSIVQIFLLLSKEYVWIIVLSMIVASPLIYLVMTEWISQFAYRINIGYSVFLIAGLTVLVVALITVSYQSMKAARINPVDSLRYE